MNRIQSNNLDLTGKKFGKGIVLKQVPKPSHLKRVGRYWQVQCECGSISIVDGTTLKRRYKSCGCIHEENLVGKKFHNGLVTKLKVRKDGYRIWEMQCDCGEKYLARTQSLTSGNTKSCGCLNDRHGKKHPLYKGHEELSGDYWTKIQYKAKKRNIPFEITIELAWSIFLKQNKKCALTNWTITLLGVKTASLDRIDSKKGYTADNIQWVHKDVNKIKQDFPEEYLIKVCKAIINHKE